MTNEAVEQDSERRDRPQLAPEDLSPFLVEMDRLKPLFETFVIRAAEAARLRGRPKLPEGSLKHGRVHP